MRLHRSNFDIDETTNEINSTGGSSKTLWNPVVRALQAGPLDKEIQPVVNWEAFGGLQIDNGKNGGGGHPDRNGDRRHPDRNGVGGNPDRNGDRGHPDRNGGGGHPDRNGDRGNPDHNVNTGNEVSDHDAAVEAVYQVLLPDRYTALQGPLAVTIRKGWVNATLRKTNTTARVFMIYCCKCDGKYIFSDKNIAGQHLLKIVLSGYGTYFSCYYSVLFFQWFCILSQHK